MYSGKVVDWESYLTGSSIKDGTHILRQGKILETTEADMTAIDNCILAKSVPDNQLAIPKSFLKTFRNASYAKSLNS